MSDTAPSSPTIVVGCDGSDPARLALELAVRRLRDGGTLFCSSPRVSDARRLDEPARVPAHASTRACGAGRTSSSRPWRPPSPALPPEAVHVELIGGRAAKALADVATARGADEIIVGSRGFGRARALRKRVRHQLIHTAPSPVTVIPERLAWGD